MDRDRLIRAIDRAGDTSPAFVGITLLAGCCVVALGMWAAVTGIAWAISFFRTLTADQIQLIVLGVLLIPPTIWLVVTYRLYQKQKVSDTIDVFEGK